MFNGMMGFDSINGGFPMMPFSGVGDFNQMMAMMPPAMQNNILGGFPNMMGMYLDISFKLLSLTL